MFLAHFFRFLRQWRAYGNSLQELSRLLVRVKRSLEVARVVIRHPGGRTVAGSE